MGNSESEQKIEELERRYNENTLLVDAFLGRHTILVDRNQPANVIIRKQHIFRSLSEYEAFMQEYKKIERKPFSLIYPINVVTNSTLQNCSTVREVKVYFEQVGKSLQNIVQTEGLFNEVKAWFLLNQISKALQILGEEYERAHWAISPSTIFRNKTNNYLIFDSFFVFGPDPTNFLSVARDNNEPLTEKIKMFLEHGSVPGQSEGKEQDMYSLGFTILFVLTGVTPSSVNNLLPWNMHQIAIEELVRSSGCQISKQMIDIIKSLTHRSSAKRMDNLQLRRLLKDKQASIIHQESLQYLKTTKRYRHVSPQYRQVRQIGMNECLNQSKIRFTSPSYHGQRVPVSFIGNEVSPAKLSKLRSPISVMSPVSPSSLSEKIQRFSPAPQQRPSQASFLPPSLSFPYRWMVKKQVNDLH